MNKGSLNVFWGCDAWDEQDAGMEENAEKGGLGITYVGPGSGWGAGCAGR